tara:strand:+ start:2019 stop:2240 length:222 start_codon:yes stop_codon:yes gene_type:complete
MNGKTPEVDRSRYSRLGIKNHGPITPGTQETGPAAKILSAFGAGRGRGWRNIAPPRQKIAIYAPPIAGRPGFP